MRCDFGYIFAFGSFYSFLLLQTKSDGTVPNLTRTNFVFGFPICDADFQIPEETHQQGDND